MLPTTEQSTLKLSIALTVCLGVLGVASGLATGSQAIIFDGMYSFVDVVPDDQSLMGHLLVVVTKVARQLNLDNGYRVIINCGRDGGQEVPHLHLHLLGKRRLTWPPG